MKTKLLILIVSLVALSGCRNTEEGVIGAWTSKGPFRTIQATNSPAN